VTDGTTYWDGVYKGEGQYWKWVVGFDMLINYPHGDADVTQAAR
jgi:hypothetical protein